MWRYLNVFFFWEKTLNRVDEFVLGFALNTAFLRFGIISWGSLLAILSPYYFTGLLVCLCIDKNKVFNSIFDNFHK
jgi:hypothetical protein